MPHARIYTQYCTHFSLGMGNACGLSKPQSQSTFANLPFFKTNHHQNELQTQTSTDDEAKHFVKVLLLGTGDAGKSTIVKQMKILHLNGFSEKEKKTFSHAIRTNLIETMVALVDGMDQFDISFENNASIPNADKIHNIAQNFQKRDKIPSLTELQDLLTQLWSDAGIKKCYKRVKLIDSAGYFLNRIDEITSEDYFPSNEDILRTRLVTSGVSEIRFLINDLHITMIDVGGQRIHRKKWLRCFESIQAVIFVASLAEYDQVLAEDGQTNRTHESINLFGQLCDHKYLEQSNMILFLNKKDLFAVKLRTMPLSQCFPDYDGPNRCREASMFVWQKYEDVKGSNNLFSHVTCATDTENLNAVFTAVTNMLVRSILGDIGVV